MADGWAPVATPPSATDADSYDSEPGAIGNGWVYTTAPGDDDGDSEWFYLVNIKVGKMLTGVKTLPALTAGNGGKALDAGIYYFNKADGSVKGQMVTGKATVETDGELWEIGTSANPDLPDYIAQIRPEK